MKISGVFLCLLLVLPAAADCGLPAGSGSLQKVVRVSDGDTIKLDDGRSVRVLGVNAPELAHGNRPAQPLANEARLAAQAFIQRAGGKVRLGFEREKADRYGRLLAHVYDTRGRSLAAELLQKGMALQIAVPPNIAQARCLSAFERRARKGSIGVWRHQYWNAYPAVLLSPRDAGFRHVRGKVVRVDVNSSAWLELEGNLAVRIAKQDWPEFGNNRRDWLALQGKTIEVRGWLLARKPKKGRDGKSFKPLLLQLRSATSLQLSAH